MGFRCPSNGEKPGRDNEFSYCLGGCQKRCMPKAILVKLRDQNVENVHKGDMISPSALKGCVRKLVLERTKPYHEEPHKLYYAVRGALIHGFLEDTELPEVQTEQRLFKTIEVDGQSVVISGQIDYYEGAPEFCIEDYKTVSDKGTYFLFDSGAKPEHIQQTNIYRWLCDGGRLGAVDGPVVNWPVKSIKINYLFMNRVVTTGTTHYEQVTAYKSPNYGKRYKLETFRKVVGHSPRGVPVWEIEIKIPPVPLTPEPKLLEELEAGVSSVKEGFEAAPWLPPGVLYDKEEAWACGFCGVKDYCHTYEATHNAEQFQTIQVKRDS